MGLMKKSILSIIIALNITGCSSMFNSGSQTVILNPSNPDYNAKIKVTTSYGSYQTRLPATISSSPSSFNNVVIETDDKCYDKLTMTVGKTVTASYWANIFNFYGFFIDPLTGAMWNLDNQVSVPVQKFDECSEVN